MKNFIAIFILALFAFSCKKEREIVQAEFERSTKPPTGGPITNVSVGGDNRSLTTTNYVFQLQPTGTAGEFACTYSQDQGSVYSVPLIVSGLIYPSINEYGNALGAVNGSIVTGQMRIAQSGTGNSVIE